MQIDIRSGVQSKVTEIVFANSIDIEDAYMLSLDNELTKIQSAKGHVCIDSEEDAINLIKALQKAIELGNWE